MKTRRSRSRGIVISFAISTLLVLMLLLSAQITASKELATGSISGRVTDGSDGIVGAQVWAELYDGGGSRYHTETDASGDYAISGLGAGDYRVNASKPGYVEEFYADAFAHQDAQRVSVAEGAATTAIDFALEQAGSISGVVIEAGAGPIANLQVQVEDYESGRGLGGSETNASGVYTVSGLASGSYRVRTCAQCGGLDYVDEYYDNAVDSEAAGEVVVTALETTGGIDFALAEGGRITGTVTEEDGTTPIADLQVDVQEYASGRGLGGTQTDASGVYTVTGLPSGSYRVRTCAQCRQLNYVDEYYDDIRDEQLAAEVLVTVPGTTGGIDFALAQGGRITGSVGRESDSQPIEGARLNASMVDGQSGAGSETDASGTYTITGLPTGIYRVEAQATGYAREYYDNVYDWSLSAGVPVTAGETTGGISFLLGSGGSISGTVRNADGNQALADINVSATADNMNWWSDRSREDGTYVIDGLPPGQYRVQAEGQEQGYILEYYNEQTRHENADLVTISTGDPHRVGLDFTLDRGGVITGRVQRGSDEAPIAGADVNADPFFGGPGAGAQTDANGNYVLSGLALGEYRVRANATGYTAEYWQEKGDWGMADAVLVTDPLTVTNINFTLDSGGTFTGTIRDPEGNPASRARISVHDEYWRFNEGAESDADGVFVVSGVPLGSYRLEAEPPSGSPWSRSEPVMVDMPTITETVNVGDIFLTRPVLVGQVTDPDGTVPIRDVWVTVHSEDWNWNQGCQTDDQGIFRIGGLPDGNYTLEAEPPGGGPGAQYTASVPRTVAVTIGTVNDVGIVRLTQPVLRGQLTLPDGTTPVPFGWVSAESLDYMVHKSSSTDHEGWFALGGMVTGTYRLRAQPPPDPDYALYAESDVILVEIRPGEPYTLTDPIRLNGVDVVGRIVDPDGNPAEWVGVDVFNENHSIHKGAGTNQAGTFAFGGLPAGNYKLEIHAPWGTTGWISPDPVEFTTGPEPVDLGDVAFLRAAKFIEGRVVQGSAGSGTTSTTGVPDVEVNANKRGMSAWAHTRTDQEGRFQLGVSGGEWEVMIHTPPDSPADWVYDGHPQMASFSEDPALEETWLMTFTVQTADAHVVGSVVGPIGESLTPWFVWVEVRNDQGQGNGRSLRDDGTFDIPVIKGNYNIWIHVDDQQYPTWSSPRLDPISVVDAVYNVGEIRLIEKTSFIEGVVARASDNEGVSGVFVHAWQHEGGWAGTVSGVDGSYSLAVISGTWEIAIDPPPTSAYVSGEPPRRVYVADDETLSGTDFLLVEAAGTISGKLVNEQGQLLTTVDGWAYAATGMSPEPVAGSPVNRGSFDLRVPAGSYRVGVGLPPGSDYTPAGETEVTISTAELRSAAEVAVANMARTEKQVVVEANSTVTVNITLLANTARIVGTFYTDLAKTIPATGLNGQVFAMAGEGGSWKETRIDPTTGRYELGVAAGTWNMGYWLESTEYVNSPPPDTRVTVEQEDVFTMNFSVVAADSTIYGHVLKPESDGGGPVDRAWVWAHRERIEGVTAAIDTGDESKPPYGDFTISVPAGTYELGCWAPEQLGYIQPDMQTVVVTPAGAIVSLQFRSSDAFITGTVYYHDEAGNVAYGPRAWVWAWSESGSHAGAPTAPNGQFRLNVASGSTWHIGATYQYDESLFYDTLSETIVVVTPGANGGVDLHIYPNNMAMPPSASVTFDSGADNTIVLADGTSVFIPAGALPITGTARVVVVPIVEELPNTLTARPFGYGYGIFAYDSSGDQIASSFNSNVQITFYYSEEELRKRGVSEDDLSVAYLSTTTNSWTKAGIVSQDKEVNKVTIQINHFSSWAMSIPARTGGTQYKVFLPVILK